MRKTCPMVILVPLVLFAVGQATEQARAQATGQAMGQPNIVFIFADDLGFSDTSNTITTLGNPSDFYQTPTIDRLAAEGMAFTNAYSSGVNCAPTRAALLTGLYAQRPTNNIFNVDNLNRGGGGTLLVGPAQGLPTGTDAIPNNAFTYAELLQQAGYQTAHVGKFHVVEAGSSAPTDIVNFHGFHQNFGGSSAGNPSNYFAQASGSSRQFAGGVSGSLDPFAGDYTAQYVQQNIVPFSNGASQAAMDALVGTRMHVSDAMTDAALQFMDQQAGGPFLLNFNAYAVHTPIQGRPDLVNRYQNLPGGAQDTNVGFAALLEGFDQNVARLIDYLETTEDPNNAGSTLAENTIVFFTSDNGGRLNQSNNGPLKGEKGELDEGGIRVPLIAWSGNPDLVDGGTVNHTPVASFDFFSTFASLAGTGLPAGVEVDGVDLSGIIADVDADLGREDIFWHFPGYLISGGRDQRPQTAMRSGDWKLLYNYEDQSFELYNLADDIGESVNLADQRPGVVAELGGRMLDWLNDTDAPLATLRSGELALTFDGQYYANSQVLTNSGTLIIQAGQEVPLVFGSFLSPADLNSDQQVNAADWLLFRSGQGADMSGLSASEARMLGDLDGDFDNDFSDFTLFKQAYIDANGAAGFAAVLGVPEPHSAALLAAVACLGLGWRRASAQRA
ncbi:MAG: sulfatase [Planctomycetota bacterium]